jgi:hypothetical protein
MYVTFTKCVKHFAFLYYFINMCNGILKVFGSMDGNVNGNKSHWEQQGDLDSHDLFGCKKSNGNQSR